MICSVLSIAENPVIQNLPYILLAIVALSLLISLIYGFSKGFRQVSWIGFTWAATAAAFFLFAKNPVVFNPVVSALSGLGAETASLAATIVLALAGVLLGLLLCTVFKALFKPKKAWAKRGDTFKNVYGIEYEGNETDYDDYPVTEKPVAIGYKKPTIIGRLLGSIFCVLNVATLLGAIVTGVLLIVDGTALKGMASVLYQIKLGEIYLMDTVRWVVADYAVDFLFLGIVLAFACKGKKSGFIKTLRGIVIKVFSIVAAIAGAYLPFSPYAQAEGGIAFIVSLVNACTGLVAGFGLPEMVVTIAGQIVASIVLMLASVILTILLKIIFALLISMVKKVTLLRKIDAAFACVAYVIIGALVCALVWAVLYLLTYFGLFNPSMLLSQHATASRALYTFMETYLQPFFATVKGFLGM